MAATVLGATNSTAVSRALCGPVGATVPSAIGSGTGKKYKSSQTQGADWSLDQAVPAGFACLKFSMSAPQYYMYGYVSNGSQAAAAPAQGNEFTATANA